jgi:hypothetical protein
VLGGTTQGITLEIIVPQNLTQELSKVFKCWVWTHQRFPAIMMMTMTMIIICGSSGRTLDEHVEGPEIKP